MIPTTATVAIMVVLEEEPSFFLDIWGKVMLSAEENKIIWSWEIQK